MKRNLLLFFLLILTIGMYAQKFDLEKMQKKYRSASNEEKASMDSIYQTVANKMVKEQVKVICGIPFGISLDKAEPMLRNKFGSSNCTSTSMGLAFRNVKYGGRDFDSVHFLFQSDGFKSYFNACIFVINANSLTNAIEKEKNVVNTILGKYTLYESKDSNGYPIHGGGMSPLWDGHWASLDFNEHGNGVHTDIIKYDTKVTKVFDFPYAVRIIYGPYNYVKEEF